MSGMAPRISQHSLGPQKSLISRFKGAPRACCHWPLRRSFHFHASSNLPLYRYSAPSCRYLTSQHFRHTNQHLYSSASSAPPGFSPALRRAFLAVILSLGALTSTATVYALQNQDDVSNDQKTRSSSEPLDALSPESLKEKTAHVTRKPSIPLLQSYLTLLMCEIPGVATYGPIILNECKNIRDKLPIFGPLMWKGVEWFVYQSFFSHYTGGESAEDCQPVMDSLFNSNIGALLNYSVEAFEKPDSSNGSPKNCQISHESLEAISQSVDSLASYSKLSEARYEPSSARMKPSAVAIKVSGLVTDPYLFKRASDNLTLNRISPFKAEGSIFPIIRSSDNHNDPLSSTDHAALESLMDNLKKICHKAKAADIVLMIDAEYSWFQPAFDRIATFLSAEFNKAPSTAQSAGRSEFHSPTVFNTFQALLRSTPTRLQEYVNDAQEKGYSIGIKLVRGAYLVSETNHWREERASGVPNVPTHPPVWSSKYETDECFDNIASSIVSQLADVARKAEKASQGSGQRTTHNPTEVSLMIAGHNPASASKILRQLRDREGLAKNEDYKGTQSLHLSDSLRGRIMFAQLYGMADNLTTTLTQILAPSDVGQRQLQPFVFKYLPFGPVEKVLPYLARRAEENQSILEVKDGYSVINHERKLIGKELRRRLFASFSLV